MKFYKLTKFVFKREKNGATELMIFIPLWENGAKIENALGEMKIFILYNNYGEK